MKWNPFTRRVVSLGEYIGVWLPAQRHLVKASSYANYSNLVANHLMPDLGRTVLNDIDSAMVQAYVVQKLKTGRVDGRGGLATKTVQELVVLLKQILRQAALDGHRRDERIRAKFPAGSTGLKPKVFSLAEQRSIAAITAREGGVLDMAVFLALTTGLRIGEVCGLVTTDIDIERNVITVNRTAGRLYTKELDGSVHTSFGCDTPKTASSCREVPMPQRFADWISAINSQRNDRWVFSETSQPLDPRKLRRHYVRLIQLNDLSALPFHSLRHSFATRSIEAGIDHKTVSMLLGHANVTITLNLYVHPDKVQAQRCIDELSSLLEECP